MNDDNQTPAATVPTADAQPEPECTAHQAATEAFATLRAARAYADQVRDKVPMEEHMGMLLGVAEGFRHLAETINARGPINPPPKKDDR